jgi:hypothetical protein
LYEMPPDDAILAVKNKEGRWKVLIKQTKADKKHVQRRLEADKKVEFKRR